MFSAARPAHSAQEPCNPGLASFASPLRYTCPLHFCTLLSLHLVSLRALSFHRRIPALLHSISLPHVSTHLRTSALLYSLAPLLPGIPHRGAPKPRCRHESANLPACALPSRHPGRPIAQNPKTECSRKDAAGGARPAWSGPAITHQTRSRHTQGPPPAHAPHPWGASWNGDLGSKRHQAHVPFYILVRRASCALPAGNGLWRSRAFKVPLQLLSHPGA